MSGSEWWLGIIIAVIIAIGVVGAAWWWVPKWQMKSITAADPKARADIEDNFEQLGSDKLTIRLGGIYALEAVMNTSPQYHQSVLEALCAFVREGTIGIVKNELPATDIQAVLSVVGRRSNGPGIVDLAQARIANADLRDANLSGASLFGTNLSSDGLFRADLSNADLISANLSGANLFNANLSGANLLGANLSGADLSGAKLDGQAQLDPACGTPMHLPAGLTLEKPCPSSPSPTKPHN